MILPIIVQWFPFAYIDLHKKVMTEYENLRLAEILKSIGDVEMIYRNEFFEAKSNGFVGYGLTALDSVENLVLKMGTPGLQDPAPD